MFSFKGKSAASMGVNCLPYTKILHAQQRHYNFDIPGKSGNYVQVDGSYTDGSITIPCVFMNTQTNNTIRDVALWLSGSGALIFDAEPDKAYRATAYSSIESAVGFFEDTFTVNFRVFPFAQSLDYQQEQAFAQTMPYTITPTIKGTQATPCIIRITALTDIDTITITKTSSDQEVI